MTPKQRNNLKRMLAPKHVAFIGGKDADFAAAWCTKAGFDGQIYGVNPKRTEIGGYPCFPSVEALPEAPDAAFVAVPRPAVVPVLEALERRGAGSAICYTAGFAELGRTGAADERAIVAAAGELALVGPNCYGVLNYVKNVTLWPFVYGGGHVERGVALVLQSGMLAGNVTMQQRSVPFSYVISCGNQAMLGAEDFIDVLADDPAVTAIGLYIEGLRDLAQFANAAMRALEAGIPIAVLKSGRSEIGSRLTVTHTGSLSGTDQLYQALFDRLGVVRVASPAMLLETLKMLTVSGAPKGRRFAAFTCSGGDAALLADHAEQIGVVLPQPSAATAEVLSKQLPAIATVSNPLDFTTPLWGKEAELAAVFGTMLGEHYDAAVLIQDHPLPELGIDNEQYLADARAFISATRAIGVPAAICSSLPENLDRPSRDMFVTHGVAPLQGINEGLEAMAAAARYGEQRERLLALGPAAKLRLYGATMGQQDLVVLDEWEGKQRLAAAGVPIPEGRLVSGAEAASAAAELGFPVVVKMVSAALPHKTEAGALRVGLSSASAVQGAVRAIRASVNAHAPSAGRDAFLVERMVMDPVAELLVGIRRDPLFGFVMTLASGGTLVELVRDLRVLLLPSDPASVAEAIDTLKVSRLLDGFRGRARGDKDALVELVMSLQAFAQANATSLAELDVNPVMVLADGVVAVDVLLRMGPAS